MFIAIYKQELLSLLKTPMTYVFFGTFFFFSLVSFLGTGGFFDEPVNTNNAVRLLNSPHELNYLFQYLGKLFLFLLPAIIGNSIYKDFKYNIYPILYSFPIDKKAYLAAKFLSAFSVVIGITLSSGLAFLLGEWLLGYENPKIGAFQSIAYIQAYLVFIIPNLFVFGLFVFTVVALSRNIYSGFVLVLLLFFIQLISENLFEGNAILTAISDPFGQNAVGYETQFWTLAEQNSKVVPVYGVVMFNRLVWLGLSILVGTFLFKTFSLLHNKLQFTFKRKASNTISKVASTNSTKRKALSSVTYNFSFKQQLKTIWQLSNIDFKFLIVNPMFYVFTVLGVLSIVFTLLKVTQNGELVMLPLTRLMLSIPTFFFVTVIVLITFIYSGMLIHRSQLAGIQALVNSTPISNTVLLFAKILALIKVQLLLLLVLMICGIVLQVNEGFVTLEIGQYLFNLFILTAPILVVWALVSVFVHTFIPNLYLGIFTLLLVWLGKGSFAELGITSHLLQFNTPPQLLFSDINGYGNQLGAYFLVVSYWMIFAITLLLFSYLFWNRERTFSFKERWSLAKFRFNNPLRIVMSLLLTVLFSLGFSIYSAEHSQHTITIGKSEKDRFTLQFSRYNQLLQPRITSVKMVIDINPESNSFHATGSLVLVNKTDLPMDTLLIKTGFDEKTSYTIETNNSIVDSDSIVKFYVHKLDFPLLPNDSVNLYFDIKNSPNTLFQRNSNVVHNGTFLKHDILPRLGYFIQDKKKVPQDTTAMNNHYQAPDSDLIDFEATISTSGNQIAITSGILQNEWQENGRNYFQYKTDMPIKMGMAFNSGIYSIKKDRWNDVQLEIYYNKSHEYNVENMLNGLKAALDYNSTHFSPYPHMDMKIVEFPLTEGSFATTFGNTLLISEARFGVNAKSEDKVDLSFYVTAHEMTHQWFGNQLLPKDVLGAVMLTESITEYITLKIYEQQYGQERALQFLKLQRLRYLKGRTWEKEIESPLFLVKPEEDYIAYGKGAMAFNTLSYFLSEDNMNNILESFLNKYQYNSGSYATSVDFLNELKQSTPDSLQYIITDMFETVTFYNTKINSAYCITVENNHEIRLDFTVNKTRNTQQGYSVPLNDFIEIAFYNSHDILLDSKQIKINKSENKMIFKLKEKPSKVVIDPNLLTIDKNLDNNSFMF